MNRKNIKPAKNASDEEDTAKVEFDQTKVNQAQIEEAIIDMGYKITGKK